MHPGDVIGERFELERHAGSGGMGEVFQARDRASDGAVAVKLLLSEHARDQARFAREVEVLAGLSHPAIVRYVAHGFAPSGEPYLVMEWLSGEDLASRLQRGPLTVDEAVALGARVAETLSMAHARGVVHRDLKPSNLFLVGQDIRQIKVLDFGIAWLRDATRMTKTGMIVGTPGYMAPEQARSTGEIDARADLFALGCVLFECLTGEPPFTGGPLVAVLAKILFAEAPRLCERVAGIPKGLDALIARMLSKEPGKRPRDAEEVRAALAALETDAAASLLAAPSARGEQSTALTGSERRTLSLLLLGNQPAVDAHEAQTLSEAALSAFEQALRRAVEGHGGELSSLADGSVVVTFTNPLAIATDQAAQAARAALLLRGLCPDRPIALATGRAEVEGKLPVGEVLERAAQMVMNVEASAEGAPGAGRGRPVVLDGVTAGLLDARFEVVERGQDLLLYGEHELASGARTLLGKATSCVGRDWELSMLEALWAEGMEESVARAVLVTAPAGMGKSRLAHELMQWVRQRGEGTEIWLGRVDSLRAGSPLGLLGQALQGALGIQEGAPLGARRQKLLARVAEHVAPSEKGRVTEFLGELVGTPFPDDESLPLRVARQDAQLMSEQMCVAFVDFLKAETEAHPVLLVLEDLHWGDLPTVRYLDTALREMRRKLWMVLALARPEVHELFPKLWAERSLQEIRLKPLSRRASERLVRQVLGDSVGKETMERIVMQADGHAFYLEELIRALAEGKGSALPETVLAMVEARLAGLPGEARRALRAASVFGEVCWESGVAELLGRGPRLTQASEWLARLVEQEVLVSREASRFPGEREFAFRHALLREGAYAMLTEEDRRLGHQMAGEWLEQRGEADPMVLAGHFERGGDRARAGVFYLRAAEQAVRSGDAAVAAARARLGLACGGPEELRIPLLGILCEALSWAPQTMLAALPYAEEVMQLSPRGSIPWAQGAFAKTNCTFMAGQIDEFLATIEVLQATDPAPEATGLLALAIVGGTSVLDLLGRARDGDVIMDRLAAIIDASNGRATLASTWWNAEVTVRNANAKEDPWGAFEGANVGLSLAESLNHVHLSYGIRVFRGMNLWFLGASVEAEQLMEGMSMVDTGTATSSSFRRFSLAWLRADRGALDEARLLATELRDFGHEHHAPLDEGRGRWVLAEVLRRAGDAEGAEREIEAALALLAKVSRLDYPGALGTLSALRLFQGRAALALTAAEEALCRHEAMGGACGMFRGAFVRLTHAEALLATGADEAARAAIGKARARLFTIADTIGSSEYKKSFLENVPENARTLALARAWLGEDAAEA